MAIEVQGVTEAGRLTNSSISATPVVVSGGTDRVLVVVVTWSGSGITITSVQADFGSGYVSMTDTFSTSYNITSNSWYRIYHINDAPVGSSFTVEATFGGGNFEQAHLACIALSGVDSDPLDTPTGPSTGGTIDNISVSEPSGSTDGIMVIGYAYDDTQVSEALSCGNATNRTNEVISDSSGPYSIHIYTFTRLMPSETIGVGNCDVSSLDNMGAPLIVDGMGAHSFNIRKAVLTVTPHCQCLIIG